MWAVHDDFGPLRWSYIIGIDLDRDVSITSERLQGISPGPMVAWKVEVGIPVTVVIPFLGHYGPFSFQAGPSICKGPTVSHWAIAPILPNGMAFLGEVGKWTTMSGRRVISLEADSVTVTTVLFVAPGEKTESDMKSFPTSNKQRLDPVTKSECCDSIDLTLRCFL